MLIVVIIVTVTCDSNLIRKLFKYLRNAYRVVQRQHRVVQLMSIPNFQDEEKLLPQKVFTFQELLLNDIRFTYKHDGTPPYALDFKGEVKFESNKIYAIIGQNRSGKTTLVNLICKLYKPSDGCITLNGIEYVSSRS